MYTILVKNDNTLLTTVRERIMQRSKLVDSMHFITSKMYNNLDMEDFTVLLEYKLPVSKDYHSEVLTLSNNNYTNVGTDNGDLSGVKLEYKLPFDTNLTKEAGDIEVQLTFLKVELQEDGTGVQYVRKTTPTTVTIVPIAAWSDIIPDNALNALDQKLLQVDAQIQALSDYGDIMATTKADNIVLDTETHEIYLTAEGEQIGDKISLNELTTSIVENANEGLVSVIV